MEKDVEEGEEDEEEVTKYVHTYIFGRGGRDPQVKESKCISRQSSSVKRQDIKRQGIKHHGIHVYSHCMGGGGGDYVHTYIFGGGPRGVEVSRSTAQSILRLHTYIHTYIHNWWHYNATSPPQHFALLLHETSYKRCNTTRHLAQDDGSTSC